MMDIKALIFLVIAACFAVSTSAQKKSIDSLKQILEEKYQHNHDSTSVDILNRLGRLYAPISPDSSISCSIRALSESRRLRFAKGERIALSQLGMAYYFKNQYPTSISFLEECLKKSEAINDKKRKAFCLTFLGFNNEKKGLYFKAYNFHKQSLISYQSIQDLESQSQVLANIARLFTHLSKYDSARIYYNHAAKLIKYREPYNYATFLAGQAEMCAAQKLYTEALSLYQESLKIATKNSNYRIQSMILADMGNIHFALGEVSKAILACNKALLIAIQINDIAQQASVESYLGKFEFHFGKRIIGLKTLERSIEKYKIIGDNEGSLKTSILLADCYNDLSHYQKTINLLNGYRVILKENKNFELLKNYHRLLLTAYLGISNNKAASQELKAFTQCTDSVLTSGIEENKIQTLADFEFKRREIEINAKYKVDVERTKNLLDRQKSWVKFALVMALCLFLIITLLLFNKKRLEKLNLQLSVSSSKIASQNEEITANIEALSLLNEDLKQRTKQLDMANRKINLVNEMLKGELTVQIDEITNHKEKLKEYAFRNSHHVRGPLARLLGLINLIKLEKLECLTSSQYFQKIEESALELDNIVRGMNQVLQEPTKPLK